MGEDNARVLSDAREHRQQHVSLERLSLVHDDEGIVEGASSDMGERKNLEEAALHDLFDHVVRHHRTQSVEGGFSPGVHLLVGITWQVTEVLASHGVERAEHHDLAV